MPRPPFARHRPLGFEPLEARQMLAADLEVLKDINAEAIGIEVPYGLNGVRSVEVAGVHFFVRSDPAHGEELWKTDGTLEGMQLVRDIVPGLERSRVRHLTQVGDLLYFSAITPDSHFALWKSDGTAEGTVEVKRIQVVGSELDDGQMIEMNGECYFFARSSQHGAELWKSDGTPEGTRLVKDIVPGPSDSLPYGGIAEFTVLNGVLYFSAREESTLGDGLWRTDGTEEGTYLVKSNGQNFAPQDLITVGDTIFFADGNTLWSSDGTTAGTVVLKQFHQNAPSAFTGLNGHLIFRAGTLGINEVYGWELWTSDGTPEGTVILKDIKPGAGDSRANELTVIGDILYFVAEASSQTGIELWRSDGTESGTYMVTDINPQTWPNPHSNPSYLVTYGGRLFFQADDLIHGRELWTSDGTEAGTTLFKDLIPGPEHSNPVGLWVLGDHLYFRRRMPDGVYEEWVSDFTPDGTHPIDVSSNQTYDSHARELTQAGDLAYFIADDGQHGSELWATDGTTAGTYLVRDIFAGEGSAFDKTLPSYGRSIVATAGNTVYFLADDGVHGEELWKSDGTFEGTVRISDIAAGETGAEIQNVSVIDGTLFFSANDGIVGAELWISDGTPEGTTLVKDLTPGPTGSEPKGFVKAGDAIYFRAIGDDPGAELWTTNGTPEGTQRLTDPVAGPFPNELLVVNDELHFFGGATGGQRILWKVISSGGHFELVNAHTFAPSPGVRATGVVGETIYFLSSSPFPVTLWKTDGTPEGTAVVKEFPTARNSLSDGFILNGKFYFVLDDLELGRELWVSDGTEAGTTLLIDSVPGPAGGDPTDFQEIDGEVYFRVKNPNGNYELWRTDGTSEGTTFLSTLLLDPVDGSYPLSLAKFGSLLVLPANAQGYGTELVYLDVTENVLPGDYNRDQQVDEHDYLFWKANWGATLGTGLLADGNGDGAVDAGDYLVWRNNLGMSVPAADASLARGAEDEEAPTTKSDVNATGAPYPSSLPLVAHDGDEQTRPSLSSTVPLAKEGAVLAQALLTIGPFPLIRPAQHRPASSADSPTRPPLASDQPTEVFDLALEQMWGVGEP